MTDAAKAARRKYYTEYRKANKAKKAIYDVKYWNRKGAAEQAKAE